MPKKNRLPATIAMVIARSGRSTRDIQAHILELYGLSISPELVSAVTDAIHEEVAAWQSRPLESTYAIVFFDALRVKNRDEGAVRNKAVSGHRGALLRTQGVAGPVDRTERRREILTAGHDRAQEPWYPRIF